ncbi:MAG: nucleoside deaminase [Xanthomonadaceae bacterium]|nr:nucleoside deaminase [Xanthomonadaceae bacterium]
MQPEESYLIQALEYAKKAEELNEVPIGAILVENNKVIAGSYNLKESSFDPTGHAECRLIHEVTKLKGNWRLSGCDLYVTLEPCLMCLAACQQARLRKVVYGAHDTKGGAISLGYKFNEDIRLNHRFEVIYFPVRECEVILSSFFKKKRESK